MSQLVSLLGFGVVSQREPNRYQGYQDSWHGRWSLEMRGGDVVSGHLSIFPRQPGALADTECYNWVQACRSMDCLDTTLEIDKRQLNGPPEHVEISSGLAISQFEVCGIFGHSKKGNFLT